MQDALKVVEKVRRSSYLMLDGVMGYEAQIAGVGDYIPNQWLKSKSDFVFKAEISARS